jgi:hypothetical protein
MSGATPGPDAVTVLPPVVETAPTLCGVALTTPPVTTSPVPSGKSAGAIERNPAAAALPEAGPAQK